MKFSASAVTAAIAVVTYSSSAGYYYRHNNHAAVVVTAFQPVVISSAAGPTARRRSPTTTAVVPTSWCQGGWQLPAGSGCRCPGCTIATTMGLSFFSWSKHRPGGGGGGRTQLWSSSFSLENNPADDAAEVATTTEPVAAIVEEEEAEKVQVVVDSDADFLAQIEAMDGVESATEAHNLDRPARKSIAKKTPRAPTKPLGDYTIGETLTGTVKTVTSYGAFIDIGAETDGLLHISNLSSDFVANVEEILQVGQECQVRILDIKMEKKQLALTMLTVEAEESQQAKKQAQQSNSPRRSGNNNNNRNSEILLNQLKELDIDPDMFVTGKVVTTVDFGAFVRMDCGQFDESLAGNEIDGLVHISAMTNGRVGAVTDVVQEGQEVQVRLMRIDGSKIALAMVSAEDLEDNDDDADDGYDDDDNDRKKSMTAPAEEESTNQEWRKEYEQILETMPVFRNGPVFVTSTRKKKPNKTN